MQYLCTKVAKLFIDLFFWTSYLSKISTCKRFNIYDLHCWIYSAGIHPYSAEIHFYSTKSRLQCWNLFTFQKKSAKTHIYNTGKDPNLLLEFICSLLISQVYSTWKGSESVCSAEIYYWGNSQDPKHTQC